LSLAVWGDCGEGGLEGRDGLDEAVRHIGTALEHRLPWDDSCARASGPMGGMKGLFDLGRGAGWAGGAARGRAGGGGDAGGGHPGGPVLSARRAWE
jgi:hypothetical protein